jgi:hypothetical protein
MDALIIVSRTNENEFDKYSNNKDVRELFVSLNDIDLFLIDGYRLNPENSFSKGTLENIHARLKNVFNNVPYTETIFAIHTNWHPFNQVYGGLYQLLLPDTWGNLAVRRYSTEGDEESSILYKKYLNPLGQLLKKKPIDMPSLTVLVKDLYRFLLGDTELDAKIGLLHQFLSQNIGNISPSGVLLNYSEAVIATIDAIGDDKPINTFSPEFRNAVITLRDNMLE